MSAPARELSLIPLGGARWEVSSRRGERLATYLVEPNRLACSCPSGSRGRACEHLRFVLAYLTGARELPDMPTISEDPASGRLATPEA
jgi:hypothetical protein